MTDKDLRGEHVGDREPRSDVYPAAAEPATDDYVSSQTTNWSSLLRSARFYLALVLAGTVLLCLGMVERARFGQAYDDGIYVTAAKSLATGQGYRLISLPEPVAQTLVPPLYPFLLSLVWRVNPRFPDNLTWMMLLSPIAMVGFLVLTWRYLVEHKYATPWQATAVVALAGINWRVITLATSIISEVVFALLAVAALLIAEAYEKAERGWAAGVVLGVVAGLTFLTRTSGVVLLIAVAFYFVLRREWKKAVLPVAVGSLFVLGWLGWGYLNRSTGGGEHAEYYAGYAYGIDATLDRLQVLNGSSRLMAHLKIIETNSLGLILVWLPLQALGLRSGVPINLLVPLLLFSLALVGAGIVRELRKGVRLLHIYLALYLLLHLIVPSHSYERYLTPILPFLLFFLVSELSAWVSALRSAITPTGEIIKKAISIMVMTIVLGAAGIALYSNWTGIYRSLADNKTLGKPEADRTAFDWIKANTDPSDVLICFGDHKYYLYTGRKAVRSVPVIILDLAAYQEREPDPDEMTRLFANIVHENQGRYVVITQPDFENQAPAYGRSVEDYLKKHAGKFRPVFQTADGSTTIYRVEEPGAAGGG